MTSPREPPSQSPKSTESSVPPAGKRPVRFDFPPEATMEEIMKALRALREKHLTSLKK
jgi:hypothetical protein